MKFRRGPFLLAASGPVLALDGTAPTINKLENKLSLKMTLRRNFSFSLSFASGGQAIVYPALLLN